MTDPECQCESCEHERNNIRLQIKEHNCICGKPCPASGSAPELRALLKALARKWVKLGNETRTELLCMCADELEALLQVSEPLRVLRHMCMADADRLFPPGTVFEDCPMCSTYAKDYGRVQAQEPRCEPCGGTGTIQRYSIQADSDLEPIRFGEQVRCEACEGES